VTTEPTIKPVGWTFTDSDGNERIKTRWQFNAYLTEEGARSGALATGRDGSTWYVWRLPDGSYDFSANPNPTTPGYPGELVETLEISGHGLRQTYNLTYPSDNDA
jgi:hypothetical protein